MNQIAHVEPRSRSNVGSQVVASVVTQDLSHGRSDVSCAVRILGCFRVIREKFEGFGAQRRFS